MGSTKTAWLRVLWFMLSDCHRRCIVQPVKCRKRHFKLDIENKLNLVKFPIGKKLGS